MAQDSKADVFGEGPLQGGSLHERILATRDKGFLDAFEPDEFGTPFYKRVPPVIGDLIKLRKQDSLEEAFLRLQYGEGTQADLERAERYHDYLRSSKDSVGAAAGNIASESLEMAAGFGLGAGVTKAGLKMSSKLIAGASAGTRFAGTAAKAMQAIKTGGGLAGGFGRTVGLGGLNVTAQEVIGELAGGAGPAWVQANTERIREMYEFGDDNNLLTVAVLENTKSTKDRHLKAFVEQWTQAVGEYSGYEVLRHLTPAGVKTAMTRYVVGKHAQTKGYAVTRKMLRAGQIDDIFSEIGEEGLTAIYGDLIAAMSDGQLADPGQVKALVEFENAAAMVLGIGASMSGLQIAGRGVGVAVNALPEGGPKVEAPAQPEAEKDADTIAVEKEVEIAGNAANGVPQDVEADAVVAEQETDPDAPKSAAYVPQNTVGYNPDAGGVSPEVLSALEQLRADEARDPANERLGRADVDAQEAAESIASAFEARSLQAKDFPDLLTTEDGSPLLDKNGHELRHIQLGIYGSREGTELGRKKKLLIRPTDLIYSGEKVLHRLGSLVKVLTGKTHFGTGKNAAGSFDPVGGSIRIRAANDLRYAPHEIGHGIQTAVGIRDWGDSIPEDVAAELKAAGREQAIGQGFANKDGSVAGRAKKKKAQNSESYLSEGFAEFVYHYLAGTHGVKVDATTAWLQNQMENAGANLKQGGNESARAFAKRQRKANKNGAKAWKELEASRALWTSYRLDMSSTQRAQAQSSFRSRLKVYHRAVTDRLVRRNAISRLKAGLFETGQPLVELSKTASAALKTMTETDLRNVAMNQLDESQKFEIDMVMDSRLPMAMDPGRTFRALRGQASGKLKHFIRSGYSDGIDGGIAFKPLHLQPLIKGKRDRFNTFLSAKFAKKLHSEGVVDQFGDRDTFISEQEADEVIRKAREEFGSDFDKAAERWYDFREGVLRYIGTLSPKMKKETDSLLKHGYREWVSFKKDFEGRGPGGSGMGSAADGSLSQRLTGSLLPVFPALEQSLAQLEGMIDMTNQRTILEKVFKLARWVPNIGQQIHRVPLEQFLKAKPKVVDVIAQMLRKAGVAGNEANTEGVAKLLVVSGLNGGDVSGTLEKFTDADVKGLGEAIQDFLSEDLAFFGVKRNANANEGQIIVWQNEGGVTEFWWVPEDLYNAVANTDTAMMGAGWGDFLTSTPFTFTKRLKTQLTTGLNPFFQIVRNVMLDLPVSMFTDTSKDSALTVLKRTLTMYAQLAADTTVDTVGAFAGKEVKPSHLLKNYAAIGLESAEQLNQEARKAGEIARTAGGNRVFSEGALRYTADLLANAGEYFHDRIEVGEKAVRLGASYAKARDLGYDLKTVDFDSIPFDHQNEIRIAGKNINVDFQAKGAWIKVPSAMIAFLNSSIQGPRVFFEATFSSKEMAMRNLIRGMGFMALPTIVHWYFYRDEEWYQALSEQDRNKNFYFPMGDGQLFSYPKSHEVSAIFTTPFETMLNQAYEDDPNGTVEWVESLLKGGGKAGGNLIGTLTPPMLPPLAEWALEQKANKNFYFDTPIVGRGLENKEAADQYTEYTSRVAISLGRQFNLSPKRIDHTIGVFFGTLGRDATRSKLLGSGRGRSDIEKEEDYTDMPVFGQLFKPGGELSHSKYIDQLYEEHGKFTRAYNSDKFGKKDWQNQAKLLLADAMKATQMLNYVNLRAYSKEEVHDLIKEKHDIAKSAIEAVREMEAGNGSPAAMRRVFRKVRKDATRRKEAVAKKYSTE